MIAPKGSNPQPSRIVSLLDFIYDHMMTNQQADGYAFLVNKLYWKLADGWIRGFGGLNEND